MRLPFLSEALMQNSNLCLKNFGFYGLWLFGAVLGTLGMTHGSVLGPLCSGSLHHAALHPLKGFNTKFKPSISKTSGIMAKGCFGAVLGTLRARTWGCSRSHTLGWPPPCSFLSFQRLCQKIWTSYLKTFRFYGLGLFWGCFWDLRSGTWGCLRSPTFH